MPKLYKIVVIRSDMSETENTWEVVVLAPNEHIARRRIINTVLAMGMYVSRFLEVQLQEKQ